MSEGGLTSIVLPVYNQADHIGGVVSEYEEVLQKLDRPHELLLVPNGSGDRSAEVCHELAAQYPAVRVVSCARRGWGAAVRAGVSAANGDVICYTNSARTSARDLMLILVYAGVYPNAVVKASRKIRDHWRRRLGSLIFNLECRKLFDLSYWDINGTPKVFPRAFDQLLALRQNGDLIDVEFSMRCRQHGYAMLEVPIFSTRRHSGKSTTNYGSALRMYWGAYLLHRAARKAGYAPPPA